jgi:hypothetical protein
VLWRKGCFGADSTNGNAFVAKILAASATCRQQGRDLLTYPTDTDVAYRAGVLPHPSSPQRRKAVDLDRPARKSSDQPREVPSLTVACTIARDISCCAPAFYCAAN